MRNSCAFVALLRVAASTLCAGLFFLVEPAAAQQQAAASVAADKTLVPYASTKDSVRLPDGRTIHMVCMGHGSPLVILTPGGNDWALVWNKVQPAVAQKTRVCSWERPGAGLSTPPPNPQTVAETTTDLQAALDAAHLAGPYVVVGHSRGAGESLLLKDREPSRVIGMVLVDPAVPGWHAIRDRVAPAGRPLRVASGHCLCDGLRVRSVLALLVVLLAACASTPPLMVTATGSASHCEVVVEGKTYPGSELGSDRLRALAKAHGGRATIQSDPHAPWRCVAGVIYSLQVAHVRVRFAER